jgi:hypothetical protein
MQLSTAIEQLLSEKPFPRVHEARALVAQVSFDANSCRFKKQLDAARVVDDELEAAVGFRDHMRDAQAAAQRRHALLHFTSSFREIRHCPQLREAPSPCSSSRGGEILEWLGKKGGVVAVLSDARLTEELDRVLAAHAEDQEIAALQSAKTPSEALLLACLTDLCRSVMRVTCGVVASSHDDLAHQRPVSNSSVHEPLSTQQFYDHQLSGNVAVVRQSQKGKDHLFWLSEILKTARSIVYYKKVEESVQAKASLVVAELLSVLDRILPPSMPIVPMERRVPAEAACRITGMRVSPVDGGAASCPPDIAPGVWVYAARIDLAL